MRHLKAGLSYFALVFGSGFVLGSIRVPLLVPRLGVRNAELAEMPLMLIAIVLGARFVVRHFAVPPTPGARLRVGLLALTLMVVAEASFVRVLQDQSVAQYVAGRDPVSGLAYLVMLVVFALMPCVLARVEDAK